MSAGGGALTGPVALWRGGAAALGLAALAAAAARPGASVGVAGAPDWALTGGKGLLSATGRAQA